MYDDLRERLATLIDGFNFDGMSPTFTSNREAVSAILAEIEAAGYELRPIGRDLTPEETESITGITDLMRGTPV